MNVITKFESGGSSSTATPNAANPSSSGTLTSGETKIFTYDYLPTITTAGSQTVYCGGNIVVNTTTTTTTDDAVIASGVLTTFRQTSTAVVGGAPAFLTHTQAPITINEGRPF
jgi:hypothetical protein